MSTEQTHQEEPVPEYKGLKAMVAILGILLVVGTIFLFVAAYMKFFSGIMEKEEKDAKSTSAIELSEDGCKTATWDLKSVGKSIKINSYDDNKLIIEETSSDGSKIIRVLDTCLQKEVSKIRLISK